MRLIPFLIPFAALAHAGCVAVPSDRLTAGELVEVAPILAALDPETTLGFAPLPGTRRIISVHELVLIARRHGILVSPGSVTEDICVERISSPLSREDILAALEAALGLQDATVELVEFSSEPLPHGRLEFSRAGLSKPPHAVADAAVVWRGRLLYDGQHSFSVWAKVKIAVERRILVAAENIPAGSEIRPEQVKEAISPEFPFPIPPFTSPNDVAGKVARKNIAAGQRFAPVDLEEPKDVVKGGPVRVRVIDGLAVVSFDAVAEASGKKGDTILVHNPSSGRNFRAVVEEKGKAVVQMAPEE